jgi:enhancing lycopene biosynthesis protein 2
MAKKVAIVLSGCGVKDGSEIHESVLTILAAVRMGAEVRFYAPASSQKKVVNHLTGENEAQKRNMLVEAARIARGDIKPLRELTARDADVLIFPGGIGAALNLCSFAQDGASCEVLKEVSDVITDFHASGKPMGFICIAPAIAAKVLGHRGVELTIGSDAGTAASLQAMGAVHVKKAVQEIHVDERNRVVSTPAYMLGKNIAEVEEGISLLVEELLEMAQ